MFAEEEADSDEDSDEDDDWDDDDFDSGSEEGGAALDDSICPPGWFCAGKSPVFNFSTQRATSVFLFTFRPLATSIHGELLE